MFDIENVLGNQKDCETSHGGSWGAEPHYRTRPDCSYDDRDICKMLKHFQKDVFIILKKIIT